MISLSVIIPTLNHSAFLKDAVESVICQDFPRSRYEIIIIDNGSTDDTKIVVESFLTANTPDIRYFFEKRPGLHIGRHLGAKVARGDILIFADDDIIATPTWLSSIWYTFKEFNAVLVGGNNLPLYESGSQEWLNYFWLQCKSGKYLGFLSLINFKKEIQEISPLYIFGCNFSIRKDILFKVGGFHPDKMPQDLIRFRGDGETYVSRQIKDLGLKAFFHPGATVYHRVPASRMTKEYFCRRSFEMGIEISFSEIRKNKGLDNFRDIRNIKKLLTHQVLTRKALTLVRHFKYLIRNKGEPVKVRKIRRAIFEAYLEGKAYHRNEVKKDPELLAYILKDNYF